MAIAQFRPHLIATKTGAQHNVAKAGVGELIEQEGNKWPVPDQRERFWPIRQYGPEPRPKSSGKDGRVDIQ